MNLYATVQDSAQVKLSGNLAVSRVHVKRVTYASCAWIDMVLLQNAIDSAQTYVDRACSYIKGLSGTTPRYKAWFGTYTDSRKSTIQDHFRSISSHQFSSFTYDCACTDSDKLAYACAYVSKP